MKTNRLNIFSMIAAIFSMGRTNRYVLPIDLGISPSRASHKRGGGRGRRRLGTHRSALPGMARKAGDYFRIHPELCQKAA